MRPSNDLDAVWLTRDPVDFRKGINGKRSIFDKSDWA